MNSLRSDGISIYPNPFTSETTIEFEQEQVKIRLSLMDALGKTIRNDLFSGKQFIFKKNELPAGVYFLRIENKYGQTDFKKVVVQ
jgi:hypothetical protein